MTCGIGVGAPTMLYGYVYAWGGGGVGNECIGPKTRLGNGREKVDGDGIYIHTISIAKRLKHTQRNSFECIRFQSLLLFLVNRLFAVVIPLFLALFKLAFSIVFTSYSRP